MAAPRGRSDMGVAVAPMDKPQGNRGPTIMYQGLPVYVDSLLDQLEKIDNIAHSELRRLNRDGPRKCVKQNIEWLKKLLWTTGQINNKLNELLERHDTREGDKS
jgi:hypothetical protein